MSLEHILLWLQWINWILDQGFRIGLFLMHHQAAFEGSDGFWWISQVSITSLIRMMYDYGLCGQITKIRYAN
jgi:hypothetical protein